MKWTITRKLGRMWMARFIVRRVWSMDPTTTHKLDGMRQAQHIVRRVWRHGFDDHSLSRWDATSTIRRETAAKPWIQRSLTCCMRWDKHNTSWDDCESMNSTATHFLNGMRRERYMVRRVWKQNSIISHFLDRIRQERYIVRQVWMHGFYDHSLAS